MLSIKEADEIIVYSELMSCPLCVACEALGYEWNPDNFRIAFLRRRELKAEVEAIDADRRTS